VENYQNYASGKWNLFKELLNEALDSEQKVVVFSQYLSMLDIMERYLSERGIGFASVRGSTRDRREQLKRFNTDPKCTVFLGSLQAVGVGVDLTAASVVIHYDRWWNPAKENQATDRVHRIGQTRGVQVFKLVTMGTVEERIDALIAQKGKLAEDILGQDDEHLLKKLSRDQLMDLFSYVPQHRGGG
jgi:SNF2 family DNA or RNA helicase